MNLSQSDNVITINIVANGFIISYPELSEDGNFKQFSSEVFTSAGKMRNRIKELVEQLASTGE